MTRIDHNPWVQFFPNTIGSDSRQKPEAPHWACERHGYGRILLCGLPACVNHFEFGAEFVIECFGPARGYIAPGVDVWDLLDEI